MLRTTGFISFLLVFVSVFTGQCQEAVTVEVSGITEKIGGKDYYIHFIKKGENLYLISKAYKINRDEIISANPGARDGLKEGAILKIPVLASQTGKTEEEWFIYTVLPKETLYGIAKKFSTTVDHIRKMNPLLGEYPREGELLKIPGNDPRTLIRSHTVVPKETLYSISRKYAVETDAILKENPGMTTHISVGQVIQIPPVSGEKGYISHTVGKKEKFSDIAQKYEISEEDLKKINPGKKEKLSKGSQILIPVEKSVTGEEKSPLEPETEMEEVPSGRDCMKTEIDNRKTFRVALLLPLFLEEVDSLDMEPQSFTDIERQKPLRFIQFYQGFILAADSLKKSGMNIDIHVYDVDNSPGKIDLALQSRELTEADLIFGPFYSADFTKAAGFAKNHKIPIINPLSERSEVIEGNPYVFKLKPDNNLYFKYLAELVRKNFPAANILIIRPNEDKFPDLAEKIRREIGISGPAPKEILYYQDGLSGVTESLAPSRENLLFVLSDNSVFVHELLSRLNKSHEGRNISIAGMPEWFNFDNLETDYLMNLQVHLPSASMVDFNDPAVVAFSEKFFTRYFSEPLGQRYAFDGFDAGWYFLNALGRFGKDFIKCLPSFHIELIQNNFVFRKSESGGYENIHWNIIRYKDYRVEKALK